MYRARRLQSQGRDCNLASLPHGSVVKASPPLSAYQAHNAIGFRLAAQAGAFREATLPLAQQPTAIGLADLNHNGRADLVVLSRAGKSVTVMLSL